MGSASHLSEHTAFIAPISACRRFRATPSHFAMTEALPTSDCRTSGATALSVAARRATRFATLAFLAALAACGGSDEPKPNPKPTTVATVRVTPQSSTVDVGLTLQLGATTVDALGAVVAGRTVTWASLQPAIATVSAAGLVTGVGAGSATITASADGVTGNATIAVQLPVSARCDATQPITVGQTVRGSILGTDCRLADTTFADKYVLTLTESTPIRALMTSASLDAYLILQDAVTGELIAENDDGNGDTNAQIEKILPAGRYVVVANSFEANQFGDYQLSVTQAPATCLTTRPITTPGTTTGTLAATACPLGDSSYTDRYLLSVRSALVLTATMRSDSLDSYLFIESTTGISIGRNDNGGGNRDARVLAPLEPGDYIINANSVRPRETGPYTLTLSSRADPCSSSRALTIGETVTDTLAITGCKLVDGSFVRRYSFTLAASTPVRLDMVSTQLDSYLLLQQAGAAATLAEDDDGGVGLNAQVLQVLPAGSYVVTATSATAGEVGVFQLTLGGPEAASVGLSVTPATVTLTPGLTQQLNATVTGSANTKVAWKSSAPGIVAVTPTGLVRAITAGAATITATAAADPSRTASAAVTVNAGTDVNLDVPLVYLTQSVQTPDGSIPLVLDRPTFARIFVRGSRSGLGNAVVRLRVYNGATLVGTVTGSAFIATTVDETCCSANVALPANLVRDGYTLVADVDPDNAIAESNEGDNAWPLTGFSKPIRVVTVPPINIQLVPIRHRTTGLVGPSATTITDQLVAMYPLARVNVTVHAEYATDTPPLTDGTSWIGMLREIEGLRALENGKDYYFGVLNQVAKSGVIGIATIRGFAGLGIGGPDNEAAETLTHEFGHSFGRQHAPSPNCGAPANIDASFPRIDGTVGFFGYDRATNAVLLPSRFDIMGYCNNTWASEYTYLGILDYVRSGVIPISASVTGTTPVLLITGSVLSGTVEVDPVFTHRMTPTAQRTSGRFVAEGVASDGRVLFRHRVDGSAVGDLDPSAQTFVAAVPYDAAVSGAVASISVRDESGGGRPAVRLRTGTYSSVQGGVSLRVDADPQLAVRAAGASRFEVTWNVARYPSIVIRSRRSGRVVGIGRRGALTIDASELSDLDALLSDGVGSTTRTLSIGQAP